MLGARVFHWQQLSRACSALCPARPLPGKSPAALLLIASSKNFAFPQLTSKVTLNDYVKTIPLPKTSSDLPTGTKCIIAGWGMIDKEQATDKLFETQVSIYSRRKCIQFYPDLTSGMVCAGSFHELKDSSQVWAADGLGALPWGRWAQGLLLAQTQLVPRRAANHS